MDFQVGQVYTMENGKKVRIICTDKQSSLKEGYTVLGLAEGYGYEYPVEFNYKGESVHLSRSHDIVTQENPKLENNRLTAALQVSVNYMSMISREKRGKKYRKRLLQEGLDRVQKILNGPLDV